jgi:DedD protein
MAKAVTDEQMLLRRRARRRLIGAVALVTLIAVVLPWILESEPRPSEQEISIQIPSPDSGTFTSRVAPGKAQEPPKPAADPGKQSTESAAATSTAATGDVLKSEQDKVLAPPAPKGVASKDKAAPGRDTKSSPVEAKKKPTERKETATDGKQYVVQIAALADAEKAQGIQKELLGKGLKAYTELVKTASGEVTRVRIGPFPSRDGAEQERSKLKALGFDGNVVPR